MPETRPCRLCGKDGTATFIVRKKKNRNQTQRMYKCLNCIVKSLALRAILHPLPQDECPNGYHFIDGNFGSIKVKLMATTENFTCKVSVFVIGESTFPASRVKVTRTTKRSDVMTSREVLTQFILDTINQAYKEAKKKEEFANA